MEPVLPIFSSHGMIFMLIGNVMTHHCLNDLHYSFKRVAAMFSVHLSKPGKR